MARLHCIGLGQYGDAFEDNAVEPDHLPDLDHDVLLAIGVNAAGHRMTILKAATTLDTPAGPEPTGQPAPHPAAATGDAERRQLTVMFCDLVGSTALAERMDPEEYRKVLAAYQAAARAAIQRYEGYIARYMGDGLMAYFGYPTAHEEDAERAVRAGLDIVAALGATTCGGDVRLSARIGVATGLVVVGDIIGEGASEERAALGPAPNLAARLQAIATPDTVVMAESTARLVAGQFEVEAMGARALKGIAEPVTALRVLGVSASRRFDSAPRDATPLVGREEEIGLLVKRWRHAEGGAGQVVLLAGEPGLGKSRIAGELLARVQGSRVLYYCSPYHRNSPLYPIVDQLERVARFERDDSPAEKLARLEAAVESLELAPEETVPYLASLLSLPQPEDAGELDPREIKRRTFDALVQLLLAMAAQHPVLLLAEDLHWADPTTCELLGAIIERTRGARVMVLLTFRPEFEPPWGTQTHLTWLRLNHLTDSERRLIVRGVAGEQALPEAVVENIVAKSDGVPLFLEELTKSLLDAMPPAGGDGRAAGGGAPGFGDIPSTLRDALMARLDRLGPGKEIAQLAAVLGRRFRAELVDSVSTLSASECADALTALTDAGLLFHRDVGTQSYYEFKHALVQEVAYESLLVETRRTHHRHIAATLLARHPELVESSPELLAHHYAGAGLHDEAAARWEDAARRAAGQSAYAEALAYQDAALEQLAQIPETEALRERVLRRRVSRVTASMAHHGMGAPETRRVVDEARALCRELGDPPEAFFPIQRGVFLGHYANAELDRAYDVAVDLVRRAEARSDPGMQAYAHARAGMASWPRGHLLESRQHLERAHALHDAARDSASAATFGEDVEMLVAQHYSITLCLLGYPDRGLAWGWRCIRRAEALVGNAMTLASALYFAGGILSLLLRDHDALLLQMQRLADLRARHHMSAFSGTAALLGSGLVGAGRIEEGVSTIEERIDDTPDGAHFRPWNLGALSEAQLALGKPQEALDTIDEALAHARRDGTRWADPEFYRIRGEALLAAGGPRANEAAESCHLESLRLARGASARWWELRTATSLARLYRDRGDRREARSILAGVYERFNEGFDTPDVQAARGLLEALA